MPTVLLLQLPLQLLLATFAGWVNRHQVLGIEYLVEENRVLKEQRGGNRLRLTALLPRSKRDSGPKRILFDARVKVVPTAFKAPDMNSIAERFVLSVKSECLNRIIPFGCAHLERCVRDYADHYNRERPHQGLGNELITPRPNDEPAAGDVGG